MAPSRPRARGISSRADLLLAFTLDRSAETASLLGFERRPARMERASVFDDDAPASEIRLEPEPAPDPSQALSDVPFWRLERFEPKAPAAPIALTKPERSAVALPDDPPAGALAGSFAALIPQLRRVAVEMRPTRAPDMRQLLRRLNRGQVLSHVPPRRRRRWGRAVLIIEDRSDHLIPYRGDHAMLCEAVERIFGADATKIALYWGTKFPPPPPPGALVIALSDLGTLREGDDPPTLAWRDYGRALRAGGCRSVAILPGAPAHGLSLARQFWEVTGWGRVGWGAVDPALRAGQVERLLGLASPLVRIEPGLLRDLRLSLGAAAPDAGIESAVWQSPMLASRHSEAASMVAEDANRLRPAFAKEREQVRERALAIYQRWRPGQLRWIWFEEIAGLDQNSQALLPEGAIEDALAAFSAMANELDAEVAPTGSNSWFRRLESRVSKELWTRPEFNRALATAWHAVHRRDVNPATPPPGFDPSLLPDRNPLDKPPRRYGLRQSGGDLVLQEDAGDPHSLGAIVSRSGDIVLEVEAPFWRSGHPPSFASDWGRDVIGPWVEFQIGAKDGGKVTQRLRWIQPGRFLMGTPDDEPGRFGVEGPLHEVIIRQGFWLFDTACTQAVWTAVMGENPSRFRGADQPVEMVNWDDCQVFLERINDLVPGLNLTLPSEAQWEYACRAGTTTPYSFGDQITRKQVNFGGVLKGTVAVGSLPANPWGLYEMHGNVLEWCADHWHGGYEGAPLDGSAWLDSEPVAGSGRVLRGGSWRDGARHCRSACRVGDEPGVRFDDFGFRCARGQDTAEPWAEAELPGGGLAGEAERRPAVPRPGGAEPVLMRAPQARATLPPQSPFVLRSDCEHLGFGLFTRPSWASAIGRDQYGLWTAFDIPSRRKSSEPVTQKMRWIPPGQFLMGSPEDEPEQYSDEGPQHEVIIREGFWLFATACTQALWTAVMGRNPSQFKEEGQPLPVETVSWEDCQRFIFRINAMAPGLSLTLPSEAQWEYACRAGTTTPFGFGDQITPDLVNYDGNLPYRDGSEGLYRERTAPVGSLPANPWGLYEMHGNLWEWCADHWHDTYDGAPLDESPWLDSDPSAGSERVLRGGSWYDGARGCRSACRGRDEPGDRLDVIGFRCARGQEPAEPFQETERSLRGGESGEGRSPRIADPRGKRGGRPAKGPAS